MVLPRNQFLSVLNFMLNTSINVSEQFHPLNLTCIHDKPFYAKMWLNFGCILFYVYGTSCIFIANLVVNNIHSLL